MGVLFFFFAIMKEYGSALGEGLILLGYKCQVLMSNRSLKDIPVRTISVRGAPRRVTVLKQASWALAVVAVWNNMSSFFSMRSLLSWVTPCVTLWSYSEVQYKAVPECMKHVRAIPQVGVFIAAALCSRKMGHCSSISSSWRYSNMRSCSLRCSRWR